MGDGQGNLRDDNDKEIHSLHSSPSRPVVRVGRSKGETTATCDTMQNCSKIGIGGSYEGRTEVLSAVAPKGTLPWEVAQLAICVLQVTCLSHTCTLMMEALLSSETSVNYRTHRQIPEDVSVNISLGP